MHACMRVQLGLAGTCELLLALRADPWVRDERGQVPLDIAPPGSRAGALLGRAAFAAWRVSRQLVVVDSSSSSSSATGGHADDGTAAGDAAGWPTTPGGSVLRLEPAERKVSVLSRAASAAALRREFRAAAGASATLAELALMHTRWDLPAAMEKQLALALEVAQLELNEEEEEEEVRR